MTVVFLSVLKLLVAAAWGWLFETSLQMVTAYVKPLAVKTNLKSINYVISINIKKVCYVLA